MKFPVTDYIVKVTPISGKCVNAEIYSGLSTWVGYLVVVRNDLEDYDSVKEWQEDDGCTTEYCYRNFGLWRSPNFVRSEFKDWIAAGDMKFLKTMKQKGNIIELSDVRGNGFNELNEKQLSVLEEIFIEIENLQCKSIKFVKS